MYIAQTWQSNGKIGLHAFKSKCLNKFKLCDLAFPRFLEEEFAKLIQPAPKDVKLGPYNGTCLIVLFKYADKNVTSLELREVTCVDKQVPFICEVY